MSQKPTALALPGGELLPYMRTRDAQRIAHTVFYAIGGEERLIHEADRDYKWYIEKVWTKLLPRAVEAEHSVNADSVENLLERLEERKKKRVTEESGQIIDVEPDECD